ERSGVPLATVKYYLREGLLMPGAPVSATRAEYGEEHLHRLLLIKALTGLGLPIPKVREIVSVLDRPADTLFATLGRALSALPPYPESQQPGPDYPRARAALECLGQTYEPDYPAVAQLERALLAAEQIGIPMTEARLRAYGSHVRGLAEADLAEMPSRSAQAAIEYAVLGTVIYEPVIAAMRRLAHQDIAARTLAGPTA
ncbi:MAG: MerR family transcriptional regulator, partial [Aldersonia sp.]|nr:MerR family transcriptional regulator [Aldersonia sp.]